MQFIAYTLYVFNTHIREKGQADRLLAINFSIWTIPWCKATLAVVRLKVNGSIVQIYP